MARISPRAKAAAAAARKHHNQWLVLIAVFKFAQASVFILIGLGAHRLLHKDVADEIELFARHLRFNPESKLINFILDRASLVNDPLLRRIGLAAFSYSALCIAEGLGLYLEKAWGEFLTLVITASFLPWEVFEIIRRLTWLHAGLLIINVLVFIYLLKLVSERTRERVHARKKK
jgi:uncharacterized membrane protein (DUF2068 family)